jgi:hypothetical protein
MMIVEVQACTGDDLKITVSYLSDIVSNDVASRANENAPKTAAATASTAGAVTATAADTDSKDTLCVSLRAFAGPYTQDAWACARVCMLVVHDGETIPTLLRRLFPLLAGFTAAAAAAAAAARVSRSRWAACPHVEGATNENYEGASGATDGCRELCGGRLRVSGCRRERALQLLM